MKEKLKLESTVSAYEQLICANEDILCLLDEYKKTIVFLQNEKTNFDCALKESSKKLEIAERSSQEANKKLDNLLVIVKTKVEPTGVFGKYLDNLKSKVHIYAPIEQDNIDINLAEHLNSLPDSQALSELFSRESEGIYHFGTKRVFVKIENGKIISKINSI